MHCPWCGFRNETAVSFCRSCGENLKTISDILDGRVPASLAVKLAIKNAEDRIGQRTEYFRLVFISMLMMLTACIGLELHGWGSHSARMTLLFPLMLFLIGSGWTYLEFKRSKVLWARARRGLSPRTRLYCPQCGARNGLKAGHCSTCSQDLEAIAQSMPADQPARLTRAMDWSIKNAYGLLGKTSTLIIGFLCFLVVQLPGWAAASYLDRFFWFLYALPYLMFVMQGLAIRRRDRVLAKESPATDPLHTIDPKATSPGLELTPSPDAIGDPASAKATEPLYRN